jgi:hypothetical protein
LCFYFLVQNLPGYERLGLSNSMRSNRVNYKIKKSFLMFDLESNQVKTFVLILFV